MKASKKTVLRILALAICLSIAGGGTAAAIRVSGSDETAAAVSDTAASPSAAVLSSANQGSTHKEETVYVFSDANGSAHKILVSDWIKNPAGSDKLTDSTGLKNISCVKGDTSFTLGSGGARVWDAQGGDVYYQGETDAPLPVEVTVRYTLDGKTVSPEELEGKSGRLSIRFDYQNTQTVEAEINGVSEKVHVPFAVLTGMILENSRFRNIEVTNGRLVNDGDRTIVAGLALPGISEDLNLSESLPEYVEITADAEDIAFSNSVTLVSSGVFADVKTGLLDEAGELPDALNQLNDAMAQLLDGSSALYEGLNTLLEKSGDLISGIDRLAAGASQLQTGASALKGGAASLKDGASTLKEGTAALRTGLDALSANSGALTDGGKQVFDSLLAAATTQLKAAGLRPEPLTIENYGKVLDGILASMDEQKVRQLAESTARSKVSGAVYAQESAIREGVSAVVKEKVLGGVLAALGQQMTPEEYHAAVSAGQIPAETAAQIDGAVSAKMQEAEITAQIDSAVSEQEQLLIEENMNSSEVRYQIDAAIQKAKSGESSISALKAQLDSYAKFYQGLLDYTAGVASADAGAAKLDEGALSIRDGAGKLEEGASALESGASALSEGICALKDGGNALTGGVTQLRDGAMQLSDGLKEFNEKGIQKLLEAFDGDLDSLTARLRAMQDAAEEYRSYSGIADEMDGSVKFIYRTDSVGK